MVTGLNPLDWHGSAFLIFYASLFVGAFIASFVIASRLRPEGHSVRLTEPDELAVLQGGRERFAEVVTARLLVRRALKVEKGRLVRLSSSGGGEVENAVLRLPQPIQWGALRKITDGAAARIEDELVRRGLLMERSEARSLGLYAAMPLILLLAFGAMKLMLGLARERPVGFLAAFLFVTAVVVLFRWFASDRRTGAGYKVWSEARIDAARLKQAHTQDETGMAVALFGTGILATSAFGDFHKMRAGSGGDGGGSDSGGGGCGGGGCGGCGS